MMRIDDFGRATMKHKLGDVQSIRDSLGTGASHGFVLYDSEGFPCVCLGFLDQKTAEKVLKQFRKGLAEVASVEGL